jgi:hypothetical protein
MNRNVNKGQAWDRTAILLGEHVPGLGEPLDNLVGQYQME